LIVRRVLSRGATRGMTWQADSPLSSITGYTAVCYRYPFVSTIRTATCGVRFALGAVAKRVATEDSDGWMCYNRKRRMTRGSEARRFP
jgi:hypothetical protein